MNSSPSEALSRYWQVRTNYNPEPVIALALQEGLVASRKSAESALDAVLQLLSCHAESPHMQIPFVFAGGEVYGMYTALRTCHGTDFDTFCLNQFGVCHHHLLLDGIPGTQTDVSGGVIYTLGQLEGHFVDELSYMLHGWIAKNDNNHLRVCALIWAKSWKHEMFFVTPQAMSSLASRWTQFVE